MLQRPMDYSIDIPSPSQSLISGFQTGMQISDLELQRQAKEMELQRRQELQKQTIALVNKPNPTARDYTNVANLLPEKEAASLRSNFELLNKDQKDNELRFGGQVMSAFSSNAPQIGIKLLRDRAVAERNSGREDQAKQYETLAELAEIDPASGKTIIGTHLGALPGGDKVLEGAIKIQKAPVEIRDIESKIDERAQRLDLDRDKLQSEVDMKVMDLTGRGQKLEPDARKLVNEATIAAVGGEQSASRMLDLAQRIESAQGGKGVATKATEWFAKTTGRQDEFTQMRQEYTRLRNTQAIKSLPPGPATDRDIELALRGFPEETANAATLASFLRGMAKMQQYEASTKDAEAEWINATGSLGRARNDIMIGDIQVPAGSTYVEFSRQFGEKRAQNLGAQQGAATTQQRGYMRFAQPQPANPQR
jgi:hypothetical protein